MQAGQLEEMVCVADKNGDDKMSLNEIKDVWSKIQQGDKSLVQDIGAKCAHNFRQQNQGQQQQQPSVDLDVITSALALADKNGNGILDKVMA